ncbi:MAG: hypothetical protein HY914_07665 [Desulfomonile tiedjei]|nr:hypothetical protein [Desulfomonile tiedjei]
MKAFIVLIVCAGLLFGAAQICHAQWPIGKDLAQGLGKPVEPGPTITFTGRFQMLTSPNVKGQTFMLDTDTGRVWILKKDHTTGDFSLQRIPVDEVDAQKSGVPPGASRTGEQKKPSSEK